MGCTTSCSFSIFVLSRKRIKAMPCLYVTRKFQRLKSPLVDCAVFRWSESKELGVSSIVCVFAQPVFTNACYHLSFQCSNSTLPLRVRILPYLDSHQDWNQGCFWFDEALPPNSQDNRDASFSVRFTTNSLNTYTSSVAGMAVVLYSEVQSGAPFQMTIGKWKMELLWNDFASIRWTSSSSSTLGRSIVLQDVNQMHIRSYFNLRQQVKLALQHLSVLSSDAQKMEYWEMKTFDKAQQQWFGN